ncbi:MULTISPECIES: hypothetical protein [unclassified Bradyrhizobium]|jgi:hypothetical protein|uniref:hypothetical protein n=1 Tax=unclassified Bradyrhizobium TaxID=2631580 RepID=UPI0014045546|nr:MULTISPECIES: hypothetical protein [unclassified Bradyrhizobium]
MVSPDVRGKINDLALDAGLVNSFTCWGMAGDLLSLEEPSHPAVRFERVTSAQNLDACASLNARAYGLSETDAMATYRLHTRRSPAPGTRVNIAHVEDPRFADFMSQANARRLVARQPETMEAPRPCRSNLEELQLPGR